MAFAFTQNRATRDELDYNVTALDTDASDALTFPIQDFDDVPSVSLVPLGTGYYVGSWRVSALSRTALTITKTVAGGSASGGARLFIKRGR